MRDDRAFERAVADWLADGSDRTPTAAVDAVLLAVRSTAQERDLGIPLRTLRLSTSLRLAAVIAIAAVIGVGAFNAFAPGTGPGSTPAPTPTTFAPLIWTPDAVRLDWPGPLRSEAAGGARQLHRVADYVDGVGDSGEPDPWTDITHVTLRTGNTVQSSNPIGLELAGGLTSVPSPSNTWIAYGVVIDLDGDGRADQRIGIDNSTADHREWITDLATSQTAVNPGPPYGAFEAFGTRVETWFVDANGLVAVDVKRTPGGIRFYAWASTISGGSVVTTDFAPDAGWIETVSR